MKTAIVTFSPTGGTHRCALELAKALGETIQKINLTERELVEYSISDEVEIVIIATPSYGGRMPRLAVERLKRIDGKGKNAVLLAVYGNRAFEDTLVELEDMAKARGFTPVAAVAAIAQHSMDEKIATDRPDSVDLCKLHEFGKKIVEKIVGETLTELQLPGKRPYKKAGEGMLPVTDKTCMSCGLCANNCPAGAISADTPMKIDSAKCLGCMRCVVLCPTKSKRLSASKRMIVHGFLSLTASKRKDAELFI